MRTLIVLLLLLLLSAPGHANSRDPIRLALGEGLDQQIMTHIASLALVKAGFKVEIVDAAGSDVVPM